MKVWLCILFSFMLIIPVSSNAQDDIISEDLFFYEVERVITASKKEQNVEDSPSAIYVITAEDLRFYGVDHLGEALRLVPGIEIFQAADHNYEISVRGLSLTQYNTSNKVLWLIDGRSVYNDAYGGVRLSSLNITLDEVDRIEVIRGPGSALYGANAFMGVINIITKSPFESKRMFIEGAYGNLNQTYGIVRFGHQFGENLALTIRFNYDNLDQKEERFKDLSPEELESKLDLGYQVGEETAYQAKNVRLALQYQLKPSANIDFRVGYSNNQDDHYYLLPGELVTKDYFTQVDYQDETDHLRIFFNGQENGQYELTNFMKEKDDPDSYLISKGRKEYTEADGGAIKHQLFDVEYQRSFHWGEKISLIGGTSYRYNHFRSSVFSLDGTLSNKYINLYAAYAQLEYTPHKKIHLIMGGRYDAQDKVGTYINPRLALIYKPHPDHIFRTGVGSATRNPHLLDMYMNFYLKAANLHQATGLDPIYHLTAESDYVMMHAQGNDDLKAERLISTELGYQNRAIPKTQFKIDLFYNQMRDGIEFTGDFASEHIAVIENLHDIFAAQGADVSQIIPNEMNELEMDATIAQLEQTIVYLETNGQADQAAELRQVVGGLEGLKPLYSTPKLLGSLIHNYDETYIFYGGEISFTYTPNDYISLFGSYAYLHSSDKYERVPNNEEIDSNQQQSPEHKINIGFKLRYSGAYSGIMFNYMSEALFVYDNNDNGFYDAGDFEYPNGGYQKIKPRKNLNINMGYQWGNVDIFVTGYNLIQDEYLQLRQGSTVTGGDLLNRRYRGGVRVSF